MYAKTRPRRAALGLSIVEMMLVMTLTAIIFFITQALLARTIESYWKVNANADAEQQIYKAQNFLERDLASAAYETEPSRATIAVRKTPSELVHLSGSDGDVLWFLSAVDPISGKIQRDIDGNPLWQRNILYYCVTPNNLSSLDYLGTGCDSGGYESGCPYKVLIRKEIDFGDPTTPTANPEPLMTFDQVIPYLDRPDGVNTVGMTRPEVAVRPVAGNMLSFRCELIPATKGIAVDLRATGIERARREGRIDSRDLSIDPATQQTLVTYFPPNRQAQRSTTVDSEELL